MGVCVAVTSLFDDLAGDMAEIVAEFGRSATVSVVTTPGTYDPATGETTGTVWTDATVTATPVLGRSMSLDGVAGRQATGYVLLSSDGLTISPDLIQRITIGGEVWTVTEVRPYPVKASTVGWRLALAKGAR